MATVMVLAEGDLLVAELGSGALIEDPDAATLAHRLYVRGLRERDVRCLNRKEDRLRAPLVGQRMMIYWTLRQLEAEDRGAVAA